jgi:Kinesin motor domain
MQVCCGHHTFNFDQVYGGGGLSPTTLYSDCVEPLVQGIFSGYNATVFAYGQTGSGKTYTMGSQFTPNASPQGIIPDALQSMFARIESQPDVAFTLRVGFIEIHKVWLSSMSMTSVCGPGWTSGGSVSKRCAVLACAGAAI